MSLKQQTSFIVRFGMILAWLWLGGIFHASSVRAAPVTDMPVTVTQPDGTLLHLFTSGDEYYHWLHDAGGYTIIQDPISGYYVYADLVDGKLTPTPFVVGQSDPAAQGLRPHINISSEQREEIRQAFLDEALTIAGESSYSPRTGTLTNLVVFIRFADEPEFTDAVSRYTGMFNSPVAGANSLRNYYQEVSYGALTIDSLFFPTPGATIVSYQDSHPRAYYLPFSHYGVTNPMGYIGDGPLRRETLFRDAINYINSLGQFPDGETIDIEGDGLVDSLTFVIRGQPDGWGGLLWPQAPFFKYHTVTINGKTADGYQLQMETMIGTGTLAHETFHVLGAPDLYHYYANHGDPVGDWDVMAVNKPVVPHMNCYMKYKYGGWISSIPEIPFTVPASYSLDSLTSPVNNCKKIASPRSTTEFFVVEYRNKNGGSLFETSLPGTGLLVYRINTLAQGNGKGPPDEVYLYRPDDIPNNANFSSNVGRTDINDNTNPASLLSNGNPGGLNLCNIGASGMTISFDVCVAREFLDLSNPRALSPSSNSYVADSMPAFTWQAVSNAVRYELILALDSGFAETFDPQFVTDPMFMFAVPLREGKYYWRVRAYNVINEIGPWSNSRSFTIDTVSPPSPASTSPVSGTSLRGIPLFRWKAVSGAVLYQFQIADNPDFLNPLYTIDQRLTSRRLPGGIRGTYYWKVRARDAAGNWSDWSPASMITILPPR